MRCIQLAKNAGCAAALVLMLGFVKVIGNMDAARDPNSGRNAGAALGHPSRHESCKNAETSRCTAILLYHHKHEYYYQIYSSIKMQTKILKKIMNVNDCFVSAYIATR